MKYHYEKGAVRWVKWPGKGDVRGHRCRNGWDAEAMQLDAHPLTGYRYTHSQWWIREEYTREDDE